MIKRILIIITGYLFFHSTYTHCQIHQDLKIENLKSQDGLINNHVSCSFQDSNGIMWFGTYSGVQTYDGNQFHLFNENKLGENLFSNHVILAIAEDKKHNLWFGTEYGLNKYEIETGSIKKYIQTETNQLGLINNQIKSIIIDEDSLVWIGTYGGGIVSFNEKTNTFKNFQAVPNDTTSLQSNLINSLFIDNNGMLWVSTENGGVSVFNRKTESVVESFTMETPGFESKTINCIFQDYLENYWFGTWDNGLIKYDSKSKTFKHYRTITNKKCTKATTVRWIEQTDKDFIWVGTYGDGLYKFNIHTESYVKVNLQQADHRNTKQDYIWNLYKDKQDNLWVSTYGSGIFMISPKRNKIPAYKLLDSENTRLSISCFLEDENEQLWIGTYTSGIYIFNRNTGSYKKFTTIPDPYLVINILYCDSNNNIWACTNKGLYKIPKDRKSYKRYAHSENNPNSLSSSNVNTILEDRFGNMWIGLWNDGINILKKDQLAIENTETVSYEKYYSTKNENTISNNIIWKFYNDTRGNIWITSPGKLTYYNHDSKSFTSTEVYSVSSVYETNSGNIWATSLGNGLYLLDKDGNEIKKYSKEDGFPSNTLSGLMCDKKDRLWLGTSKGVAFLEPESGVVANFDTNYGIEFNEANINAYLKTSDGKIVYGGNEGFNIFSPEELGIETCDWKVYFNNVKVLYESNNLIVDTTFCTEKMYTETDSLFLESNSKMITINFSAVNYFNPQGIKYSYCLEGIDKDWILTDSKNRQVSYTNLPPNKYVFKVRASYNEKNWGVQQAKLFIDIKEPLSQKTWFRLLLIFIGLSSITTITRIRLIRIKQRLKKQNEHLTNEKLKKEQELLRIQNEKLNSSIDENRKNLVSLAFKNINSIEKMEIIYRNLKELDNNSESDNKRIIKNTIKLFEHDSDEISNNNYAFNTSVDLAFDDFQKRLSVTFPKLTHKDLRICSYIRMNKDNKTIAQQLNITIGSLDTSRYRIRKKMNLNSDTNLNDFLIKF